MTCIGGYFEWEATRGEQRPHSTAQLALTSGRACLRLLVELERPSRVWLPYYACDALGEPLLFSSTLVKYYGINGHFEIEQSWPEPTEAERLICINYFGLKTAYVEQLEGRYGDRLWVDNTQAYFYEPNEPRSFHFNSARKFFGVPDGAYLYAPPSAALPPADSWPRNTDYRFEHLILREQGKVREGYPVFQDNERAAGRAIARMSTLSESILSHIDYAAAARQRRENYLRLHETLAASNQLSPKVTSLDDVAVPFCYPYLPNHPLERNFFWERDIFVPAFWRECDARCPEGFAWEKHLSAALLPLPVDHRYGPPEMDRMLEVIRSYER